MKWLLRQTLLRDVFAGACGWWPRPLRFRGRF